MNLKKIIKTGSRLLGTLVIVGCMTKIPATVPTTLADKPERNSIETVSDYSGNQLENGSFPYIKNYGIGEWSLYPHGNNSVIFRNNDTLDSIVFLERIFQSKEDITDKKIAHLISDNNLLRNEIVRHNYIRAGSSYEMLGIPNGNYFIKIIMGKDWNPDKLLFDGKLKGGFDKSMLFSVSNDPSEFLHMNRYVDDEGTIHYTTYEVSLCSVSENMINRNGDKIDFLSTPKPL